MAGVAIHISRVSFRVNVLNSACDLIPAGCSRPKAIGEVAHQEEVVQTLEKALEGSANVGSSLCHQ